MVETLGVEPKSSRPHHGASTCVAGEFGCRARPWRFQHAARDLVCLKFRFKEWQHPFQLALVFGDLPLPGLLRFGRA